MKILEIARHHIILVHDLFGELHEAGVVGAAIIVISAINSATHMFMEQQ